MCASDGEDSVRDLLVRASPTTKDTCNGIVLRVAKLRVQFPRQTQALYENIPLGPHLRQPSLLLAISHAPHLIILLDSANMFGCPVY
jgi:hypothetical protein